MSPFPEIPLNQSMRRLEGHLEGTETRWSGGVVVVAAAVEHPDLGHIPALVFRFRTADNNTFHEPIALVLDETALTSLPQLVAEGIELARTTAEAMRHG